ncbi:MAG TPA: hypothetical protein VMK42_01895 [Anaeromyxobacteraceae bacterium]|nr:hypothetical protein [Anaeromyxobacteraceae bacterium]
MTFHTLRPLALLAGLALAAGARAQPSLPPGGPPAEALQACASLQVGAACSFTAPDGREMTGKCVTGPNGEAAACLPPHPHHRPPPEAFEACSGLAEGTACSVSHGGHTLSGTCRSGPEGSPLACAPSGPPPERP